MTEFQGWLMLAMLALIAATIALSGGLMPTMWFMLAGAVGFLGTGLAALLR